MFRWKLLQSSSGAKRKIGNGRRSSLTKRSFLFCFILTKPSWIGVSCTLESIHWCFYVRKTLSNCNISFRLEGFIQSWITCSRNWELPYKSEVGCLACFASRIRFRRGPRVLKSSRLWSIREWQLLKSGQSKSYRAFRQKITVGHKTTTDKLH